MRQEVIELFKLLELIDANKLVLPDFQRDFEWEIENQRKLLASFLVGLPVGNLLLLEGTKDDYATKAICFANESIEPKPECQYLLDGQQRVSTLKSVFTDLFHDRPRWGDIWNRLYSGLRFRWFLRVCPEEGEDDIFGWKTLHFPRTLKYEPDQVLPFLDHRKIYKTITQDWYHPGYIINGWDNKKQLLEITRQAAQEQVVPLYTVYEAVKQTLDGVRDKKFLHEIVIDRIATNRAQDLQETCSKEDIYKILEQVEPDARNILQENPELEPNIWAQLKATWAAQFKSFLHELLHQVVPSTSLPTAEIGRAISIFESINRGGTPLDTFDLVVARAARNKDQPSLSQRIASELAKKIALPQGLIHYASTAPTEWAPTSFGALSDNRIDKNAKNHFLNLLSIICYSDGKPENIRRDYIRPGRILNLSHEEINESCGLALKGIIRAYAFLQIRCGISKLNDMPYKLMLLPIAYLFLNDDYWSKRAVHDKAEFWYWASLFSGRFREKQNERCIEDLQYLVAWVEANDKRIQSRIDRVMDEPGYSSERVLLYQEPETTVPRAVVDGIKQFILSSRPRDFIKNDRISTWDIANQEIKVHVHHIYPLANTSRIGETAATLRKKKSHILNSPLNLTIILEQTNLLIGAKDPERYLRDIAQTVRESHFMPYYSEERRAEREDELSYYSRLLKMRYSMLKTAIKRRLEDLAEV